MVDHIAAAENLVDQRGTPRAGTDAVRMFLLEGDVMLEGEGDGATHPMAPRR